MDFTLRNVDQLIKVRAKVLHGFSQREDRLAAISIISSFWHGKEYSRKLKQAQEALATDGKQVHVFKVTQYFAEQVAS